jgi:hypothetical protein
LAAVIGLILLAGSVAGVRQYQAQARISTCKMHLAALRQSIGFYKFRTGFWPQLHPGGDAANRDLGYVTWSGTATLPQAGQFTLVVDALPPSGTIPAGAHVVLTDDAGSMWARTTGNSTSTTINITPAWSRNALGTATVQLAGLFSNRDDSGNPFLDVAQPPGTSTWGRGLGDRWTGVAIVRNWYDVDGRWNPKTGFAYDGADPTDWGGLAYNPRNGEIHYYLPSTEDTSSAIGNFSGDPPFLWGR